MNRIIKIALFVLLLLWCAAFLSEFFIPVYSEIIRLIPLLKSNFSLLCHQEHRKLITLGNYESLVCARCAGIYLGALYASLFNLFRGKDLEVQRKILVYSAIPMIIDVIGTSLEIYKYSKILAFLTGFLFGIVSFLYFYSALLDLIKEIRDKKK